jgi:hypothetical protein
MYTAASYLVESLGDAGEFSEFLDTKIWKPLGMNSTYLGHIYVEESKDADMLAKGYYWEDQAKRYEQIDPAQGEEVQGGRLVFSTVKDHILWVQAMINSDKILSKEAYEELRKPRISVESGDHYGKPPPFGETKYALGHYVETYRKTTIVGHTGNAPGFGSLMRYIPDQEWGVVIFGNSTGASKVAEVLFMHLLFEELGVNKVERDTWLKAWNERSEHSDKSKSSSSTQGNAASESPPLAEYAGHYWHPGYHNLYLKIEDGKLCSDCSDRSFQCRLDFKHKFGEEFEITIRDLGGGTTESTKAVFYRDSVGKPYSLGLGFEKQMGSELIDFDKVGVKADLSDLKEDLSDSMEVCESENGEARSLPIM